MFRMVFTLLILINQLAIAEDHTVDLSPVETRAETHRPLAPDASTEKEKTIEEFKKEYADLKKDEGGCIWRDEDWKQSEKDPAYKALMTKICKAEKLAMDLANKDRARYCKEPLIHEQRLSFISRANALDQFTKNGMNGDSHANWYAKVPHRWLREKFPKAAKVMAVERENFWGMGGGGLTEKSAQELAQSAVNANWINSPGHHAPMIDCENRYAGVGFMYSPRFSQWIGYMTFAELKLR